MTSEQLLAAAVGGLVGFIFAYLMARIQRRWDSDRARREAHEIKIQRVEVPLEMIRGQIQNEYRLDSYFNRASEDRVMVQIREAIYALNDPPLSKMFEVAVRPFHEYAGATTNPKEWADKCLPHIANMLDRLKELSRLRPG